MLLSPSLPVQLFLSCGQGSGTLFMLACRDFDCPRDRLIHSDDPADLCAQGRQPSCRSRLPIAKTRIRPRAP